MANRCELRTKI